MIPAAEDHDVIRTALGWLEAGHPVILVTVLRTWGSSPRPPGSLLSIDPHGRCVGSVSGGCADEQLAQRFRHVSPDDVFPCRVEYGIERDEAQRMGLPCGGRLQLLVERLDSPDALKPLAARLDENCLTHRRVDLQTGSVTLETADSGSEFQVTETMVCKTYGPGWGVLLIGDGQIARYLAGMAVALGYRVTICDPRPGIHEAPLPGDGVACSRRMPDDEVRISSAERTAIVTLAHDPRVDDLGLIAALESPAFYIGALGSVRTADARRQRLLSLGVDAESIARIHAPAGLGIGSKRPSEIALSILAQITAVRNLDGVRSS
ncbi:MAG: XdhC family protein [Candidatus Thiodiazotropha sp.]